MSDETTGVTPAAESTERESAAPFAESAAATATTNGDTSPAQPAASAFPDSGGAPSPAPPATPPADAAPSAEPDAQSAPSAPNAAEDEMQQMPPLDEIEVPGGVGGVGSKRYDGAVRELAAGEVVTGTVVHIDHEGVLVDVGAKSEGLVRPNELSREPVANMEDVVQVGDTIDVLVMEPEGKDGNLLLSKKRADFEKAWDRVQEALQDGRTIQAMVSDRVKGGLVVDLGIRGFVPASHVGNGKLKNLEKFVGQSIPLKVLEVDRDHRKVVLSHRLATEEERQRQKEDTIASLEEGQTREGVVRRVTDYGAFVDLGGIDGLLHVSEMSWTRVKHPSDVVKVGDQIPVMILKLNLDQGRVSLGMRQILPDPWTTVGDKYHVGDVIEGEVTRLVPFGAFVLLEGGIEGIIPNGEMAHRRIAKPGDVVEQGQMVQIKVIDVRPEERRLTLSLRALQPREPADDYRSAPRDTGGGAPPRGPAEPATDRGEGGAPRGGRGGRRGGRGREEGEGDFRQFMSTREEPRVTLGDMFGDMLQGGGRGARAGRERRRGRPEEEEEDLSNFEDDFDPEASAAEAGAEEARAEEAGAEAETAETEEGGEAEA